jgi:hypothetical protein
MFDVFIIQKIRDEEERRRQEHDRPRLEVPLPELPSEETEADRRGSDDVERGVLIIENDEE